MKEAKPQAFHLISYGRETPGDAPKSSHPMARISEEKASPSPMSKNCPSQTESPFGQVPAGPLNTIRFLTEEKQDIATAD
jgi:hypothetical protein